MDYIAHMHSVPHQEPLREGTTSSASTAHLVHPRRRSLYTIVALIGQANAIPESYGYFAAHPGAKSVLQTTALFSGIFLWLFSFWVFAIAVMANAILIGKMPFALTWWAFIFPNVGFTLSTVVIGRELGSDGILWVGSVMTALVAAIWCVSFVGCVRAVWTKSIVWPGKDEDKDR